MGEQGTPPSLDRYLYAYSNPTVYTDIEGYYSVEGEEFRTGKGVPENIAYERKLADEGNERNLREREEAMHDTTKFLYQNSFITAEDRTGARNNRITTNPSQNIQPRIRYQRYSVDWFRQRYGLTDAQWQAIKSIGYDLKYGKGAYESTANDSNMMYFQEQFNKESTETGHWLMFIIESESQFNTRSRNTAEINIIRKEIRNTRGIGVSNDTLNDLKAKWIAQRAAIGLIQFMPSIGVTLLKKEHPEWFSGKDKWEQREEATNRIYNMSMDEQLCLTRKYFESKELGNARYMGKAKNLSDFYSIVFYPAAFGKQDSDPAISRGDIGWRANQGLDTDKNGIITVKEFTQSVWNKLIISQGPRIITEQQRHDILRVK